MKQTHYKYLDGLRALAAMYVVIHHALPNETKTPFAFGHLAVTLFIVLSGFCLMLPVAQTGAIKGGAAGFFVRRWKRILPPYFAALALSIYLAPYTGQIAGLGGFCRTIAEHLVLMQDFQVFPYGLNAPLWSVAVEWHIYIFFPLVVLAWKQWGAVKTALGAMAFALIAEQMSPWKSPSMHFYGDFAVGAAACCVAYANDPLSTKIRERFQWGRIASVGSVMLVALLAVLGAERYESNRDAIDLAFTLLTSCLLVACAVGCKAEKLLSAPVLVFFGGFSYSIYLVHQPLIFLNSMHQNYTLWLVLPSVVLFAYVFHLAFEKPFMTKRAKLIKVTEPGGSFRRANGAIVEADEVDIAVPVRS